MAASMGGGAPALRVARRMAFLEFRCKDEASPRRLGSICNPRCGGIVTNGRNLFHIFEYLGPPLPSGGTQVMFRLGSLMSQVLQWTQFWALITNRDLPPSSTHS